MNKTEILQKRIEALEKLLEEAEGILRFVPRICYECGGETEAREQYLESKRNEE